MESLLYQAEQLKNEIVAWRRKLHQTPELDLHLPQTQQIVCDTLDEMGIAYKTFSSHSGIVGTISGANLSACAKTVALRADMDALPIAELADVPYAATNNNMHACGHDAHTAMLLGAAKLLSANRDKLRGHVRLIFQPGEEKSGGAERMIEEGVLDNPPVDVIFAQHTGCLSQEIQPGHFGFYPGAFMASIDSFTIRVKGRGCHGSSPADGVDPIVIAAQIVLALQTLVSREIRGTDSAVLTIGAIHGGQVYNIIPDAVEMIGAVRCLDENVRLFFAKRIREVCTGIAQSMRGDCTVEYRFGFPVTVNQPDVTTFAMECAERLFSADCVQRLKNPLMGSEDMAYFLSRCPGCYWIFSTAPDGETPQPNHSAYFSLDDSNLYKGSALLAAAAMEWLEKQSG